MGYVKASDIANFLNVCLLGDDLNLIGISSLDDDVENTLSFSKNKSFDTTSKKLVITTQTYNQLEHKNEISSIIKVANPRLAFAKIVNEFFIKKQSIGIHASSIIGNKCIFGDKVTIGANCYIGENVQIGNNSIIGHNVVIADNTEIGNNCYVKSGTVIGEDGFGFDFETDGTPVKIPHIGKVVIGNNVEVGAKNTIARATLGTTIIANNVKIDDQVHIAHNCHIGENTIITACVEISGSVVIGKNCWIGPNSSIIQKVKIGNHCIIGIGTVITIDVEDNKKIMGLEGLDLRNLVKVKKRIEYGK
jgi:UDP-3-O-[3-hydroxymyristoyl] glucosamine N-acyltransferase LpxD